MERERKKLWRQLMAAWDSHRVCCHKHFAKLYTRKYPYHMYGWIALADVLYGIASYDEAMVALQTAKKLSPQDKLHFIYHQFGHFYMEKGNYRRAERWYRKAIAVKEIPRNLVFLGACLAKQGKYRDAKGYYRRAIKIGSEVVDEAYLNLGLLLRAEERFDEALACFERALELDPKYTLAKMAREDIALVIKLKKGIKTSSKRGR